MYKNKKDLWRFRKSYLPVLHAASTIENKKRKDNMIGFGFTKSTKIFGCDNNYNVYEMCLG
jgi:hypothetical protein